MATITYGKGKILQPTSLEALKARLHQNAHAGRIEMPDTKQIPEDSAATPPEGFVGVRVRSRTIINAEHFKPANHAEVRAGVKAKRATLKGRKASVTGAGNTEVRITINAPDVQKFFSLKKKKEFSY
ncbi:MAG: hypothetical protein M3R60_17545 [Pseudomonadota bacterium]|nr:hypothetical protein [Pseudomonadota bacterium]